MKRIFGWIAGFILVLCTGSVILYAMLPSFLIKAEIVELYEKEYSYTLAIKVPIAWQSLKLVEVDEHQFELAKYTDTLNYDLKSGKVYIKETKEVYNNELH